MFSFQVVLAHYYRLVLRQFLILKKSVGFGSVFPKITVSVHFGKPPSATDYSSFELKICRSLALVTELHISKHV